MSIVPRRSICRHPAHESDCEQRLHLEFIGPPLPPAKKVIFSNDHGQCGSLPERRSRPEHPSIPVKKGSGQQVLLRPGMTARTSLRIGNAYQSDSVVVTVSRTAAGGCSMKVRTIRRFRNCRPAR